MFSSQFTDAEITALLLHEVGHNFQTSISGSARYLNFINKSLILLYSPILILMNPQVGPFRNLYTDIIKKIDKDYSKYADVYYRVKDTVITLANAGISAIRIFSNFSAMLNPIGVLQQIPQQILNNLNLNTIILPSGLKNEMVSDAFVSAYGYGPELTSVLSKISKSSGGMVADQIYRDIGGPIGAYFDLLCLPSKIICNIFDPHPNDIARLNNQYKYLSKELLDNEKNPKMKKEIQKQMSEIKSTIDKFVDAEEEDFFFSNRYDKMLLMIFGGDIRNGISNGINSEFDDAQKRAELQLQQIKK